MHIHAYVHAKIDHLVLYIGYGPFKHSVIHIYKKILKFVAALCTKWIPEMEQLPLKVTTKTIAFSGRSLYHPESREVVLTVSIAFTYVCKIRKYNCKSIGYIDSL